MIINNFSLISISTLLDDICDSLLEKGNMIKMEKTVTLEETLELAKQLSLVDKIRLIEQIAPQIEKELTKIQSKPRQSLRGIWQGADITESDIDEVRKEMWSNFPREDI